MMAGPTSLTWQPSSYSILRSTSPSKLPTNKTLLGGLDIRFSGRRLVFAAESGGLGQNAGGSSYRLEHKASHFFACALGGPAAAAGRGSTEEEPKQRILKVHSLANHIVSVLCDKSCCKVNTELQVMSAFAGGIQVAGLAGLSVWSVAALLTNENEPRCGQYVISSRLAAACTAILLCLHATLLGLLLALHQPGWDLGASALAIVLSMLLLVSWLGRALATGSHPRDRLGKPPPLAASRCYQTGLVACAGCGS
jgi:hypothetical protein